MAVDAFTKLGLAIPLKPITPPGSETYQDIFNLINSLRILLQALEVAIPPGGTPGQQLTIDGTGKPTWS